MVAVPDRLDGRDGTVWRLYVGGMVQEAIAARVGISQSSVSRILAAVREGIADDREHLVQRERDFLDQLRAQMLDAVAEPLPPAVTQSGKLILDENGDLIRDPSNRLAAVDRAVRLHERLGKLLGLDAATKVDLSVQQQAAQQAANAAADAAGYLNPEEAA